MSQATWTPEVELYNPLAGKQPLAIGDSQMAASPAPGYERVMSQLRDRALEQFTAAQLAEAQPDTVAWLARCAGELVAAEKDRALSAGGAPAFSQPAEAVVQALLNEVLGMGPIEDLLRMPEV